MNSFDKYAYYLRDSLDNAIARYIAHMADLQTEDIECEPILDHIDDTIRDCYLTKQESLGHNKQEEGYDIPEMEDIERRYSINEN